MFLFLFVCLFVCLFFSILMSSLGGYAIKFKFELKLCYFFRFRNKHVYNPAIDIEYTIIIDPVIGTEFFKCAFLYIFLYIFITHLFQEK